ncbi:MAG: hypothetical protein M1823_004861 [Watsoniomyces obsoletus]|nr:MAG: hypothetical protein M1823_004861 [Watsoniomyces obsoletus]
MALAVLGYTHSLLARQYLSSASYVGSSSSSPEDRTKAFQTATKHLLLSSGIHLHLASSVSHHSGGQRRSSESPELSISVQTALSELALAEATLLAVSKDDPYARAVAKELDPRNKEWMIKAPDLPKVRAHLFARLCIAAGEHLEKGIALLNTVAVGSISTTSSQGTTSFVSGIKGEDRTRKFETIKTKISPSLLKYMNHLRRTARAKACRFLAIDVELSGEVGKGIGWLKVAQMELFSSSSSAYDSVDEMTQKMVGLTNDDDDDDDDGKTTTKLKMKSFGKWKSEWNERRLDRKKMEKTVGESSKKMNDEAKTRGRRNRRRKNEEDDNDDDGRIEEGRIIRYLLTKWEKTNDTVSFDEFLFRILSFSN